MTSVRRQLHAGEALSPDIPLALRHLAPIVTVVGDLMLDGWWVGRTERMSREAPAPVVEVVDRRYAPGGAANTAMNLAALGARVRMVGVIGQDAAGDTLRELLVSAGVDVSGLLLRAGIRTVTKNRIISGDQILLRIDEVHESGFSADLQVDLAAEASRALIGSDALIVCDYGSEALLGPVRTALTEGIRPALTVVDAHDPSTWSVLRPDLVTPNAAEAFRLLGRGTPANGSRAELVADAAARLHERTGASSLVVTLDRDGTIALDSDGSVHRTRAQPGTDKQAAGAGDTFVAALTLARMAGLALPAAATLAQAAADVVVQRFGTSVCSTSDLVEHLGQYGDAALTEQELLRRISDDRAAGKRIVLTNGCFDVLHRGHTSYLAQAAQLGDVLVVAVNSDDSVRRLKGSDRPINQAADRAGVLAALSCVDYVTIFDSDTPIPLIERLHPEIYAKGGDYTPDMLAETAVVRACGGEVRILDYVAAHSTTAVVGRIRAGAAESDRAAETRLG
jgi:D-beta-D-heptose 7-phosphate kinase / D-beta-D-heptose 1-phosphate adenosyltransferase